MNTANYYGIDVDLSKDNELTNFSASLLNQYYRKSTDASVQQAYARACWAYSAGDMGLAQRMYDYISKGWCMFSTPILANAIEPGQSWKGLPISCFAGFVSDTLEGLIDHSTEIRWLSVKGGGTAGHWSNVRSVSSKAPGPVPFLKTMDSDVLAYHQGSTRRGSYAAYLDMSHPEIQEFITLRTPTGGDPGRKCFNIHNAVNITDAFMNAVATNSDWDLIDPHDGQVRDTVSARKLWQLVLETRSKTGEPYMLFIDTANRALPQSFKDLGLTINGSNLCSEILSPTSSLRTFVCCLMSVVAEFYEEWKHSTLVEDCIRFLDNVLQIFIDNAPDYLHKAKHSAQRERSLGLGLMGFHSYLQSMNIPFESASAKFANMDIFNHLNTKALESSKKLAIERGEYLDGIGTGLRNGFLTAIAPNANSAIIANTSPSIEPINANAYTHKTRAGSFLVKNKHLSKLLETKNLTEAELEQTWNSIINNQGSVQHLTILDDWEKLVYKTAFEINQEWVVEHAADRQPFISHSQSVNLFFPFGSSKEYVNRVHVKAWKTGVKSLYYYRTSTAYKSDSVSTNVERKPLSEYILSKDDDECLACQA